MVTLNTKQDKLGVLISQIHHSPYQILISYMKKENTEYISIWPPHYNKQHWFHQKRSLKTEILDS
jgi:hypothetical protein